jgi:hypothetical protein
MGVSPSSLTNVPTAHLTQIQLHQLKTLQELVRHPSDVKTVYTFMLNNFGSKEETENHFKNVEAVHARIGDAAFNAGVQRVLRHILVSGGLPPPRLQGGGLFDKMSWREMWAVLAIIGIVYVSYMSIYDKTTTIMRLIGLMMAYPFILPLGILCVTNPDLCKNIFGFIKDGFPVVFKLIQRIFVYMKVTFNEKMLRDTPHRWPDTKGAKSTGRPSLTLTKRAQSPGRPPRQEVGGKTKEELHKELQTAEYNAAQAMLLVTHTLTDEIVEVGYLNSVIQKAEAARSTHDNLKAESIRYNRAHNIQVDPVDLRWYIDYNAGRAARLAQQEEAGTAARRRVQQEEATAAALRVQQMEAATAARRVQQMEAIKRRTPSPGQIQMSATRAQGSARP